MIDNKSSISTFIEEGAAYPHTYSIEEFAEELTPVENVKFVKDRSKKALINLDLFRPGLHQC